jgi:Flp pilus assembly protein TadD
MPTPAVVEALPVAEVLTASYEEATRFLEQALQTGRADPNVAYLLALAHKRQGKLSEARTALRKINPPDANVMLQMGILSFLEKEFGQAEQEFVRAQQLDPSSYEISYNLLLTRLALGKIEAGTTLIGQTIQLAPGPQERSFLTLLQTLLRFQGGKDESNAGNGQLLPVPPEPDPALTSMSAEDEQRLLQLLRGIGQFDATYPLLTALARARPRSLPIQEAHLEAVLVQCKKLAQRCQWDAAEKLLTPLARIVHEGKTGRTAARSTQIALLNLLGCCATMTQDFDRGARYFAAALQLAPNDAWLNQNLALARELQGRLDLADPHWNRYFDLLDRRVPMPSGRPDYLDQLAFEACSRLADSYQKKEKWQTALTYLQRASRLRPKDPDTLERLFHLYNQAKRPDEARKTLSRLRQIRPNDPQFDLYELDLRETKSLEDLDRMLTEIKRILGKYPGDLRVEERAVNMAGNVIPLMGRLCEQLTEQMNRILDQIKHLSPYQINWRAVREAMRDLEREFQKLRRITNKCLSLVTHEEHRSIIRALSEHIDRQIERCQSTGG